MSASSIEPNVSTDNSDTTDLTKLSAEELLDVVATLRQENKTLLKARNKVGLTFKRIPEDGNDSITRLEDGQFPFLTKIDSLSVTKDASTDGNIALIEGENLAVLSALQMTHKKKVDVIYIDPPYNTGNDDFIYEDKRMYKSDVADLDNIEPSLDGKARTVGKDDPFRHSKWLSFMERRLFLAKELLSDTGVILVSIDDNEHSRVKLLMDSIFGDSNFIANLIWKKTDTVKNDARFVSSGHEYILAYAKDISGTPNFNGVPRKEEQEKAYKNADNDPRGTYRLTPLYAKSGSDSAEPFTYTFSNGQTWTPPEGRFNRFSNITLKRLDEENRLLLDPKRKNQPMKKTYRSEVKSNIVLSSLLPPDPFVSTRISNLELSYLIGKGAFQNPKPSKFVAALINSATDQKNALILDFFAGSGTTGHAVAELNKEDGGNRSAILVTNNEGGIARNVTRERLARVLTGENWADGKEHEPLPGNLSFYTLGFKTLSSNPLTTAQMMELKFDGLLSLENNALNVVENDPDEDYAIYRNSGKVVFVWKNLFSLYDGECEELLESLKNTMDADEYIAYIPSESETPGITSDGWEIVSFPHEYIERYEAMIATMRRNQTLPNSNK